MEKLKFTNNAATTLSGSLSSGGTTLVVATGTGSMFPSLIGGEAFLGTIYEKDVSGNDTRIEVFKVTAVIGDTFTIARDVESMVAAQGGPGSGGFSYPSSVGMDVYVELRWTALDAIQMLQKDQNLSDVGSASAARANLGLGSAATQASSAFETAGAVSAHVAAGDPHGQYAMETTIGAANGIAGLDASGKVPMTQLPISAGKMFFIGGF